MTPHSGPTAQYVSTPPGGMSGLSHLMLPASPPLSDKNSTIVFRSTRNLERTQNAPNPLIHTVNHGGVNRHPQILPLFVFRINHGAVLGMSP